MKINKTYALKISVVFALFAVAAIIGCQRFGQGPVEKYSDIKYSKIGDIKMPEIKEVTLANGMRLFLLEDHELPLINISAMIHTGSVYEEPNKVGLASITGEVMRTGGTATKSGDQIDEELERIAASVETRIGVDSGSANLSVLKEDFDTGLAIFADVLMNPAFAEEKIELAKIRQRTAIARRNDNINSITIREYNKLIYGSASPYARQTEYATINAIRRDDLVNFYKRFYCPNNCFLAVCGDFNTDEMIKKIDGVFKGWQKCGQQVPPLPAVSYQYKYTVNEVSKDDLNQSCIYIGHLGGLMNDPDYPALVVMNRILGGGFTSRMFRNIRSRMGLAYSAGGNFSAGLSYPGIFYVSCQTKCGSTVKAIKAMEEQIKSMTTGLVTDEELAIAKDSYLNTFVFNFDTKSKIINRVMMMVYYGYPEDFIFKVKQAIEKVTKEDVLRVSKKNLQPDKVQILAVGKPAEFDQPLSTLGSVNEIDITIPPLALPAAGAEPKPN
jgi:zinc protease